ncbi:BppU family phage baseplate upper protein [Staphylococcus saprophyticus]|uniref:BppU family phage baseplate upper protein n=1 Tax=Staphylococcus saprophyticus TaxID=29385 RepID=UPI00140336EE|nr:BppU family phage baseplate upper protein [Staphylococcus saprophyticus]
MVSNLDKKTIVNMENTARYQPRSNLNIAFSTADRDSAVFIFNVTKDNKPLLLSAENVVGHIALKHSDGSFVKDKLHFTEPDINGRFEYYIPNDVLKREGTVTMQVFISEKGNSNVTVAERIVTFDIEKSIISQISAETKLQYIVEYDELQAIIANRVTDIENKMANAEDYVSQLEQAREKGLKDIDIAKSDSIESLNDLAAKRLEEINNKANEYSSKFDDDKQYMDDKHQAFKESVLNSEVVTQGESENWQKYKLVNDTGTQITSFNGNYPMTNENLLSAKTGFYYNFKYQDSPSGNTGFVFIQENAAGDKKIYYSSYNYNDLYIKSYSSSTGWIDWKKLVSLSPDEKIETQNSAESRVNETLADAKQYTDEKMSTLHEVLFTGSVTGVSKNIMLNDDYNNFDEVRLFYSTLGGRDSKVVKAKETNQIVIHSFNLTNSDGSNGDIFETIIDRVNGTTLKISNEVRFNLLNQTGGSTSGITITEIIGVKY